MNSAFHFNQQGHILAEAQRQFFNPAIQISQAVPVFFAAKMVKAQNRQKIRQTFFVGQSPADFFFNLGLININLVQRTPPLPRRSPERPERSEGEGEGGLATP